MAMSFADLAYAMTRLWRPVAVSVQTGNTRTWTFTPAPDPTHFSLSNWYLASQAATYRLLCSFHLQPRVAYETVGCPFGRSRRAFKRWKLFARKNHLALNFREVK